MTDEVSIEDVDFELPSGVTEEQLDAAIASGDPEAVDSLLDGQPENNATTENQEDEPGEPSSANSEELDSDEPQEDLKPDTAESDNQSAAPEVVLTKDGKHAIPYEVLESTRKQAKEIQDQLNSTAAEKSEIELKLDQLTRLNAELTSQLKRNNLEPAKLPEDIELSEELLSQLNDYGEVGEIVRTLYAQNRYLMKRAEESPQPHQETENPNVEQSVNDAIGRNSDLNSWRSGDQDRWETAISIDDKLRTDPAYKDKSYDDRFAEVVRRTKAFFGDPAEISTSESSEADSGDAATKAAEAIAKAQQETIPQSLTEVGRTPTTEKSEIEVLGNLSESELMSRIDSMTQDQLEALYSRL